MSASVAQVLREARKTWPDVITSKYVQRYVEEDEITADEAREILEVTQ